MHGQHHPGGLELAPQRVELGQGGIAAVPEARPHRRRLEAELGDAPELRDRRLHALQGQHRAGKQPRPVGARSSRAPSCCRPGPAPSRPRRCAPGPGARTTWGTASPGRCRARPCPRAAPAGRGSRAGGRTSPAMPRCPGVSWPTSFLSQRAQPTSAAFERSRAAGTTRPLMNRRSLSVWKQNCVFTQARLLAGTYSSQTAGGSTTWLSQSNTGKSLRIAIVASLLPGEHFCGRRRLVGNCQKRPAFHYGRVGRHGAKPPGHRALLAGRAASCWSPARRGGSGSRSRAAWRRPAPWSGSTAAIRRAPARSRRASRTPSPLPSTSPTSTRGRRHGRDRGAARPPRLPRQQRGRARSPAARRTSRPRTFAA